MGDVQWSPVGQGRTVGQTHAPLTAKCPQGLELEQGLQQSPGTNHS